MPNMFDVLVIALFGGTVLIGFLAGLGKVLATLGGIYGGALLAALFYRPFSGQVLAKLFPAMSPFTAQLVAFLLLLGGAALALGIALGRGHLFSALGQRLGLLGRIGGGPLGVAVGVCATILAALITSLGLQVFHATADLGASPAMAQLQDAMASSALVPMFLKLAPVVIAPLRPFFPQGLPPLLAPGSL